MTNLFDSEQKDCFVTEGTNVGVATKPDMSDVQYGKFWRSKVFGPTERVRTLYGQDGALRWIMRLNNLYLIIADRQVQWLAG
jgi:hypothetical protein